MKCRPGKWLYWTPLAALPLLAAGWLNSAILERDLDAAAAAALKTVGADWAQLSFNGRDATLSGEADSEEAAGAAARAVAATWGVRRVDSSQVKVVVPVVLTPPTVGSIVTNNNRPEVRGTWPEGMAKTLALTLPDRSYSLGKDQELTSDGKGNWVWFAPKPMIDGSYEIAVEVTDGGKSVARTAEPGKLVIDTAAPAAPAFLPIKSNTSPDRISGTWAEGDAVSLRLSLAGNAYVLTKDESLTTASGRWTLAVPKLAAGTYDLLVETADEAGNPSNINVSAAIVITPKLVPPTVAKYAGNDSTPPISGTFDVGNVTGISVEIGGNRWESRGNDGIITDAAGTWRLEVQKLLKDGYYDVVVTASDAAGNTARDATVAEVIIDTTGPAAPAVDNSAGRAPAVHGTWPEGDAKSLQVVIGGKTYQLGKDPELSSAGGNWTLAPIKLPDGYYDVVATAADAYGNETRDQTVAEVIVDTQGPAVPSVEPGKALPVTGTFAAADTKRLRITLAGKSYALGRGTELNADGDKWVLQPAEKLAAGTYDVAVAAADEFGNLTTDTTHNELTIAATETPPPPPPLEAELTAPTVNVSEQTVARPAVSGTWPEGVAKSLKVSLAGASHVLGEDPALASAAGVWMLTAPSPLKDGVYDVAVEITGDGKTLSDTTKDELTVDAAGPAAPTVTLYSGEAGPSSITGTWAEGDATSLAVTLAGKANKLGTDQALSSDGKGGWTLALAEALKPGSYDIAVVTADKRGRLASDQTRFEILVKETKTVEPPPPETEMTVPTVTASEQLVARPAIAGTWAEGIATSLKVSVAGTSYVLGTDDPLKSAGGAWTLKVPLPLADGVYDVVVETADQASKLVTDATKDELVVDAAAPSSPTVKLYAGDTSPSAITGTWAEGDAVSLTVTLAGTAAKLGTDDALTSDGKGNWTLTLTDVLKSGSYDVEVVTADKHARTSSDQTRFEILVKETVEPPPPPPPPPETEMKAPTVSAGEQLVARPAVTGTWSEGAAKSLKVTLAGASYVLGTDNPLKSSNGVWTLNVPLPLKDGVYDLTAETADGAGKILTDTTKDELVVDAAGPAIPTVKLYSGVSSPSAVTGTWAEGDAVSLAVTLAGGTAKLGTDQALNSDGKGGWALTLANPLKSGSYDVVVTTADKHGRTAADQTRFEILVKDATGEPPPPPPADCVFELTKTLLVHPVNFETGKSAVPPAVSETIKNLAQIAGQCASGSLEIGGHTDNEGSDAYNQALSERRAIAVAKAMMAEGVGAERLAAVGYGETVPLATNATEQGRTVNRRIEIKIVK